MKKILFTVIGLIVPGFLIQLVPYGHDHSNQTRWRWYSNIAPVSWLVYHDVTEGRQHTNFSDCNRPEPQHVGKFQRVFDENSVPPASYLLLHPDARLSPAEKQQFQEGLMLLAERYIH